MEEYYGVDLDGTLAEYDGWKQDRSIGKAIPLMLNKVKQWISEGINIVIFTARADDPENVPAILEWLDDNGLSGLEITNIKTPEMSRFYDDRAIQVEKNTGRIIGDESLLEEWIKIPEIKLNQLYNKKE